VGQGIHVFINRSEMVLNKKLHYTTDIWFLLRFSFSVEQLNSSGKPRLKMHHIMKASSSRKQ